MKKLLATTALLLTIGSTAFAQNAVGVGTATASSGSSSNAISGSQAQSNASGGQAASSVYIDQSGPSTVRSDNTTRVIESGSKTVNNKQSGTVRQEFAPAVSAPAFGSGHPCGLGGSVGVSIIGGGLTGGATRVDDACLLAQMGKTTAAMAMIAARNSSACAALVASGDISPNSKCGDGKRSQGGVYAGNSSTGPAVKGTNGQPMAVGQRQVSAGNVAPVLAAASSRSAICEKSKTNPRAVVTNAPTQQGRLACAASLGMR
jgi:hypothetical protein